MARSLLILALLRLLSLLPLRLNHAFGWLIGCTMALIPNNLRHVTRTNIALAFPGLTAAERARLVRASLVNTAQTATETAAIWHWPMARVLGLIREVSGGELLEAAITAGKGAIIAGPHVGAWEIVGPYCADRYPMTILYRPLRLKQLNELVIGARCRNGVELAPTDARGIRQLYQALADNQLLGILPDQEPGGGAGVFAPFFGTPAYTMVLLSRLAAKSGAPVLFACAERLPKGRGYHLHFIAAPEGIDSSDKLTAATALNRGVELCAEIEPSQYQWAYKRYNSRPQGESRLY